MQLTLTLNELCNYVSRQMGSFFPDRAISAAALEPYVSRALERCDVCFSQVNNKYFRDGQNPRFDHLHSDQYGMFLYYLSNSIWRMEGDLDVARRTYCLIKALNGIDVFYEVELPDVFLIVHGVGSVLGRARYSNYFVVYQGCTVGSNLEAVYPVFGEGTVLYGGSTIVGACELGLNCWVSNGTLLMNTDIPPDSLVFGRHPDTTVRETHKSVKQRYFLPSAAA